MNMLTLALLKNPHPIPASKWVHEPVTHCVSECVGGLRNLRSVSWSVLLIVPWLLYWEDAARSSSASLGVRSHSNYLQCVCVYITGRWSYLQMEYIQVTMQNCTAFPESWEVWSKEVGGMFFRWSMFYKWNYAVRSCSCSN